MALKPSSCGVPMRNILLFGVLLFCCSLTSAERCSSYTNIFGTWIAGFDCPGLFDGWYDYYCCGTNDFKYCCDNAFDALDQNSDWDDWDDDWDDAADAVGTAAAIAWWIIIAIVCGVLAAIFIPLIICCVVCGKASSGRSRGRTTVVTTGGNNAVAPVPAMQINTVTGMNGMNMGYPAPPPSYTQTTYNNAAYSNAAYGQAAPQPYNNAAHGQPIPPPANYSTATQY
ncbi:uncharacterized protein [Amphiura filiformis]|uniref:uncharacterized protein n=1 Tax=Amphiura filiformis TaxID=82378 RepID=UPI003B21D05D